MSNLIEKLTAEGPGESVAFLNDIIAQLWPNINVAGCKMTKEIVEPMFKTMLPGPLATLHFTKLDLGTAPLKVDKILATKTETNGIKLDLNVNWDAKPDISLDADMIPQLGVNGVKLSGRLSVLLCPLTNVIPLIGAAQVTFVNPPVLELDFSGAAEIADLSVVKTTVHNVILGIIESMLVLPNRLLVPVSSNLDYFMTYLYPEGIVRITVDRAWGFAEESKTSTKKFFSKITRASPDCYANVSIGAETPFKTKTKANTTTPVWNETHDFVVTDFDQCIKIDVKDEDVGEDAEVGLGVTTVRQILEAGGKQELAMVRKGKQADGLVSLSCEFFEFAADANSFSAADHSGEGRLCGIVTILVAGAFGIKGQREDLKPSVKITWGAKHKFQTAIQSDAPGTDISNPTFNQNFRIPVTADLVGNPAAFRIELMNGEKEMGGVDVPFADVQRAPDMILQNRFDVGDGATVRASISLKGIRAANMQKQQSLPQR